MFYMYILKSKIDASFYVGSTNDLRRRLSEHNSGKSIYTKHLLPWKVIYYEAYSTYDSAFKREMGLKKRARSWQELMKRIWAQSGEGHS